jgi:sugar O-acyltransferase (sialic acid O-acetyltransferase NeuD family)
VNTPVIGLGAGGHARVLIETIQLEGKYEVSCMLDRDVGLIGKEYLGVPVLGTDELLSELAKKIPLFFIGLGSTGRMNHRVRLFELASALSMRPIRIIHPRAIISGSAILGEGVAVLAAAIINACAMLGSNVIVNTGVIVEHDVVIGNHVHLATGARVCGGVVIGDATHIGAGSTILQGVKVGSGSIIGAGAVVLHDVPPGVTVVGVPARIIH